jgi:hypothetical protein
MSTPNPALSWPLSPEQRVEIERRARRARAEAFTSIGRAVLDALRAPLSEPAREPRVPVRHRPA